MINCLSGCLAAVLLICCCYVDTNWSLEFVQEDALDKKLQVVTASGVVQGSKAVTVGANVTYYKFLGVPYAAPPVGSRRWKPPVAHEKWGGVLNATYERSICVQNYDEQGEEDCLYLNVYTPQDIAGNASFAVMPTMVFFHGGRFLNGFAGYAEYGPDYLLEKNVVFVSFNYRLGIFGFLSAETTILSGNYGLKDQLLVLTWVKENIRKFGGDPDNVTIFGESAGGALVGYMLLSQKATGLFHKAISQSGSALCPWAFQREPKKFFLKVLHAMGIFENDTSVALEKLQQEDSKKLRSYAVNINMQSIMDPLNGLPFAPCIEDVHADAFLVNRSNELFDHGLFNIVPYIIGYNSQEALIMEDVIEMSRPYIAHWDVMPQLLVPHNLNITTKQKRKEAATKIKEFYFDSQFVRSIRHNVQLCSLYTNVFFYVFSYEGVITKTHEHEHGTGVGHGEDLYYLFRATNYTTKNIDDIEIRKDMVELWTTFAKLGNPTPSNSSVYWPAINKNALSLRYLDIDTSRSVKENPRAEAMDFWDDLYKEFGSSSYDTY